MPVSNALVCWHSRWPASLANVGLYAQLLMALGAPQNPRSTVVDLEQVTLRLLRAVDVQVLLLDEIHNILAGTFREQRIVLNTLRYLSNELKISLVCFGVNEAREAISGDVQLARRFEEYPLPRWSADEDFEQLVLAIVRNCLSDNRASYRRAQSDVSCKSPAA